MKSFDKFQFDSSPLIDEEMEDLDESLVGAVRSAGQVIGNRLKDTGKALQRAQKKASTLTSRAASKVQSVQKNLNKKIENVGNRVKDPLNRGVRPPLKKDPTTQKVEKKQSNSLLNKSGSFTGLKPVRPLSQRQKDNKADAVAGLKAKGKLPSRFEGQSTKTSQFRDLTRGGLRSSLARTAGSALLNVGKGLAQKPTRMVSYNQAGTGSLGAFQDLGQNVQGAARGLMNTKRFQPTTSVKTGYKPGRGGNPPDDPPPPGGGGGRAFRSNTPSKTTPGKEDGRTIGSTLLNKGLNAITNQKDSVSSKKKPVETPEPTGSARVTSSNRTDIPQGKTAFQKRQKSDQKRQDVGRERTRFANKLQKIANQPTPRRDRNIIKTGTKTKPDAQTQKDLDNFKPSDILDRPRDNQSFINRYLQDLNKKKQNSSIVPTKKKPVSRTDLKKKDVDQFDAASPLVKMGVKSAIRRAADDKKAGDYGGQRSGIEALRRAVSQQARTDDKNAQKTPASKATVDVTASQKKTAKDVLGNLQKFIPPKKQKLKRPNIRSYKNDPDGYEKARAAYNAQSPENKTRKGGGRPKKQTNQEGNENEMQKYKKDLKKRGVQEQFSDWREQFLWEVDKKYPEKVKEIKPMTGKNTITVNPEDKGAKYKRGY